MIVVISTFQFAESELRVAHIFNEYFCLAMPVVYRVKTLPCYSLSKGRLCCYTSSYSLYFTVVRKSSAQFTDAS